MKSLFKRSLAAATGSVLALSQLAMIANVNISAAVTADGVPVDKACILDVAFDADEVATAELKDGYALIGHATWAEKLTSQMVVSGDKSYTSYLGKIKDRVRPRLKRADRYIDPAKLDQLMNNLGGLTITTSADGSATATIELAESGALVGSMIEDAMSKSHGDAGITADDGAPIVIDWTGFSVKGSASGVATIDPTDNTVTFNGKLIDENGNELTDDKTIETYALTKLAEAKAIIAKAANECGHPVDKFLADLDKFVGKAEDGDSYARKFTNAVLALSESANELNEIYNAYVEDVESAARESGAPAGKVNRIINKGENRRPADKEEAIASSKLLKYYDKSAKYFNDRFGDTANITVTAQDLYDIIVDGEDEDKAMFEASYEINGDDANAVLFVTDDQIDELTEAFASAMSAEDYFNAGWTVVLDEEDGTELTAEDFADETKEYTVTGVAARKMLTASAETTVGMKGTLAYNAQHAVFQIIVEESTKETTTTTDDTTTIPDETTTIPEESTTVPEETTTAPEETTTVTYATGVSFDISGISEDGLVYWSEEKTKFDEQLKNLSIKMNITDNKDGALLKTIDVTPYFALEASSPAELTYAENSGVDATDIPFVLKDAAGLQKKVTDEGYEGLIEQEGLVEGKEAGRLTVYLVLRGDTNLDGVVGVEDAQMALEYYVNTAVVGKKASDLLNGDQFCYLHNKAEAIESFFPFSHYAADAANGNGALEVDDAQMILAYYVQNTVVEKLTDWADDLIVGAEVTPKKELHANPLVFDEYAAEYASKDLDKSVAQ